ncbi:LexA family transcriptional regulator [Pleomorphovibrio marinus]|uniref:LexA family transcriptional regulator n=1 Tax=Pleomorphovibrio marinus TaxID=2164132 RepID=UPI000E0B57D7|nr:LexA family transcriptional regulator [Pleomorphovibrio marinus]
MSFSNNLKWLRRNAGLTQEALSEKLGVRRPMISAYEDGRSKPKMEAVATIAKTFEVSIDDLVQRDLAKEGRSGFGRFPVEVLTVAVDVHGEEQITLVPQKAAAGYLNGYADAEYFEKLPQFKLPQLPTGKTYRAFELSGDSMLPLGPGTVIIGAYLDQLLEIKNGMTYILVTKSEGVVYKRAFNYLKEKGKLYLVSDNEFYKPFEVPASEVLEVWEAKAYISTSFPDSKHSNVELTLKDLADMIQEVKNEIRKCQ